MKKSAIIGMVVATVMSVSAFAANSKQMDARITGEIKTVQEQLRGEKGKDGKVGRIIGYETMSESAFAEKKGALVAKVSSDRATELRDYVDSGTKAEQIAKMETLENLYAAKRAAETVPGNAEATEILNAVNAGLKVLALVKLAEGRKDDATLALADQVGNIANWKPAQRLIFAKFGERFDVLVNQQGMETRPALEKAYGEAKGITDPAAVKKAVEKIKELCKKGLV
jgi:hypothetical protein